MIRNLLFTLAIALVCAGVAGSASAEVEITVRAEKQVEVTTETGETELQRVEAERAVPGEVVIYTILYTNPSEQPAENVKITNPIPQHMVLTGVEPAKGLAEVTFSIDRGVHYDARENLKVVDAVGNARPAEATDLTHIRWTLLDPIGPGAAGSLGFRAELQ